LIYHEIICDSIVTKTPPPCCPPFEMSGSNAHDLRRSCLPLQQSLSRYITC